MRLQVFALLFVLLIALLGLRAAPSNRKSGRPKGTSR